MCNNIDEILSEYVKGLTSIFQNHLKQVILYGSYARGEQNQNGETSDIDILILVNLDKDKIKKLKKKVIEYSYDINLKYNILLSPIIENDKCYENRLKYIVFYKNIEKEGVLLNG